MEKLVIDRSIYIEKAVRYLNAFCNVKPNRHTGSAGNRRATEFFKRNILRWGYEIDATPFPCLDYRSGTCTLKCGDDNFEVFISPYSTGCLIKASLITVSNVKELEKVDCSGEILLMKDELCTEQLMPKNFVFYNPEHHQHIYSLLEQKQPAAIITATSRKPELVGALYPFPLIEDADFDIPVMYCKDVTGDKIAGKAGKIFKLSASARRIESTASNVVASRNPEAEQKIVVCAHIDAYGGSPGALDNASGTTVLLLVAEMLKEKTLATGLEIIAFNGEDNYSAAGQMDYLKRYEEKIAKISLAVNIDDVAYIHGKTAFSFYGCSERIKNQARAVLGKYSSLTEGGEWYQGDHMIFVQKGIPSAAFTSDRVSELMSDITHTELDTPEKVDTGKLVELAEALTDFIISF